MKKIMLIVIAGIMCFSVIGKEFQVPVLTGRIVDKANVLSKEDIGYLEGLIKGFEANTKGQFAVCIVPSLEGEAIEQVSMKIAEKWKIGYKGKDNGILFVLAPNEREYRLEIGYGFEGALNDAKCGDIGRKLITPAFKEKQWAKGIGLAVQKCDYHISGKTTEELKTAEENSTNPWIIIVLVIVILILMFGKVIICGEDYFIGGSGFGGGSSRGGGFGGGGGSFGGGGFSGKF